MFPEKSSSETDILPASFAISRFFYVHFCVNIKKGFYPDNAACVSGTISQSMSNKFLYLKEELKVKFESNSQ